MPPRSEPQPLYFSNPAQLRRWLEREHARASVLWIGCWRVHTCKPTLSWPQIVDEVLCFGWIDGLRRGIDAERHAIRITPRKAKSSWSDVNLRRVPELIAQGRMHPAGLAAWEQRDLTRSGHTTRALRRELAGADLKRLKANPRAFEYYRTRSAAYRRDVGWWVTSAKREQTRERRLAQLIDDCAHERAIPPARQGGRDGGAPAARPASKSKAGAGRGAAATPARSSKR